MKAKFPLFEVGLELEYFIHKNQKILNAQDVVAKELGFSIDQRGEGLIKVNDELTIRTDGTCVELQMFRPYQFGRVPTIPWGEINKIPWLNKFERGTWPFLQDGAKGVFFGKYIANKGEYEQIPVAFLNPGKVFGSGKEIINAYTNERKWGKKEGDKDVTTRTAGLHLHFSVISRSLCEPQPAAETKKFNATIFDSFIHTNELIKLADKAFKSVFIDSHNGGGLSKLSQQRIDKFQTWGDYRVKRGTVTGNPTLEYRQPDASMESESRLQQFATIFNHLAVEYVNSIK
jgi:hypothetical protein